MNWQIKPNQFSIIQTELHKVKIIKAIKVDVQKKIIEYIQIENCIEYIQKNHNFFNYIEVPIAENMDCFFIGIDKDLRGGNSYCIKGYSDIFYGNAILVKVPKSCNFHKLQNTKLSVDYVRSLIVFK